MLATVDARLAKLGIELPPVGKPVANFVACVRTGRTLYLSGQIPSWNGQLRYVGRVGAEISPDDARAAARLSALNLLAQVKAFLGNLDRVTRVSQLQGFVNAVPGFTDHPAVVNGASDLLVEVFGEAIGKHARFAVGAGSLPFNVAVELAAVLEVAEGEPSDESRQVPSRRVDVFFYGLFMDQAVLRAKGLAPESPELAFVPGFALRIGQRATLVQQASGRVHGVVMSLTLAELQRLYADASVQAYEPQAVLAHLAGGGVTAALCYTLPHPPLTGEPNPEYVAQLRSVAQQVGLPAEYIALLQ